MCSFTDKEVSEFIQAKKRWDGHLEAKKAVSRVGRQENGSWVLNEEVIVGVSGQQVSLDTSPYTWIGHLLEGPGVAKPGDAIPVEVSLSSQRLEPLVQALRSILKHNFFPGMLVLGACAMSLHYEAICRSSSIAPWQLLSGHQGLAGQQR